MKLFTRISLGLLMGFFVIQASYGQTETESRRLGSFDGIKVSGAIEVELTESDRRSVVVEAHPNHIDAIETHVDGSTLHIQLRKGYGQNVKGPLKVYVKAPRVGSICASGAVKIVATNTLRARDFDLNLSGASSFHGNLRVETVVANLSGASLAHLSGNAEDSELEMSGASNLKAGDLEVAKSDMNLSGASRVNLHVHEYMNVVASGGAMVAYEGSPEIRKSTTGGAVISKK